MTRTAEILADRGGPALIIFGDGPRDTDHYRADYVALVNGGVMHEDADGNIRWHPPQRIQMVIWDEVASRRP